METKQTFKSNCKSVFKNGKNTISKAQFTEKWIEMIHQIEKRKCVEFDKKV